MKKFAKKNNKGFSLVELIVVVLIMAIIAVALAPQVMKWVNNARISADVQSYDSLVSNVQLAYTTKSDVYTNCSGETYTVTLSATGTTVTGGTDTKRKTLTDEMTALVGDWAGVKAKVKKATYTFTVIDGKVTKTAAPDGDSVANN
ncbi:MAG: type II secretion system GspH family protein [Lachnospiraceae bacterium]|nr:type II secretion system GspH family protein [Lachnospiraceae bacterium]